LTAPPTAPPSVPLGGRDLYVFGFPYLLESEEPKGVVEIKSPGDGISLLSWRITSADPRCDQPCTAARCCGLRIHEGTSCEASPGPPLWNPVQSQEDPWTDLRYFESIAPTDLSLKTGLESGDLEGRTMIIYDFEGIALACGKIEKSDAGPFQAYPGYDGDFLPAGGVQILSEGGKEALSWILTDVDPQCSTDLCTLPNCCGVHIHEGTTCENAGAHFWNAAEIPEDPWQTVRYKVLGQGPSIANLVVVVTRLTKEDIFGRALVVHDFSGTRIACAIIDFASETTSPGPKPEPEPNIEGAVDKLEDAIDQIRHALGELGAAVNGSNESNGDDEGKYYKYKNQNQSRVGHSPSSPSEDHSEMGHSPSSSSSCNSICFDICSTQRPQPVGCQFECRDRTNSILDVVELYCLHGLCPSTPFDISEEVGLLQSRRQDGRSNRALSKDRASTAHCREQMRYCQLFCEGIFAGSRAKDCFADCQMNFFRYQRPLQAFVDAGCCDSLA